jgi:fatty acid amide hydrolase
MAAMPGFLRSLLGVLADLVGQKRLAKAIRYKKGTSLAGYSRLLGRKRDYSLRFSQTLAAERLDALICPPDALPALLHGSTSWVSACTISYAGLYSLLGMPAGVVAATRVRTDEETGRPEKGDVFERAARRIEQGSTGLPIGVQVAARQWREDVVISIMSALEYHFRGQADYPCQPPSFKSAVANAV